MTAREFRARRRLRRALLRLVEAVKSDIERDKIAAVRHAEDELRRWAL